MSTKIEWANEVWNPVTGCSPVSEGCRNCYARRMAQRLKGRFGYPADDPFKVTVHKDKIEQPRFWKKPRRVFVCSMGDLFHKDVSQGLIFAIFAVMMQNPKHTFMVLSKRPGRMGAMMALMKLSTKLPWKFPPDNVWLGVSVESQEEADRRIPVLLQIPAARRFVSLEPMLAPVELDRKYVKRWNSQIQANEMSWMLQDLNWVIAGCESGPKRRQMDLNWVRSIRDQCQAVEIPFFLKQMEVDGKVVKMPELDGKVWDEVPGEGKR